MPGEPLANGRREIYTLDVGQADAHVIIAEDGTIDLIDADVTNVGEELDTILVGRTTPTTDTGKVPIETFVLTHLHDDHSVGVHSLHEHSYEIQHIDQPAEHRHAIRDPETGNPPRGVKKTVRETYVRGLEKHGVETIHQVSEGDSLSTDWDAQVIAPPSEPGKLEFISPETGQKNTLKPTGANANSIAFKTEGEQQSMLFMGDVEDTGGLNGETRLLSQHDSKENDVDLDADILILSHHGSKNATSEAFLDRVDPAVVLISSGLHNDHRSTNRHDVHPHDATLKRLHDREIDVYWTPGNGTLHTDLDSETPHPEPTTDLDTTDAADLAALKYHCREHDRTPADIKTLAPGHLPEETPEWIAESAPLVAEAPEEIVDAAIANAETIEEARQVLEATPDAHEQLRQGVQADRDKHVTTRADVNRNREVYFSAKQNERAYRQLPLHTRLRAKIPTRFGGIEHPLKNVPSPDEIDGPRDVSDVPKAVRTRPAAEKRARGEIFIAEHFTAAEEAADRAVERSNTADGMRRSLRETPGAHKDFLYAIDTPNAHRAHEEPDPDDGRTRANEQSRTIEQRHDRDHSLGL